MEEYSTYSKEDLRAAVAEDEAKIPLETDVQGDEHKEEELWRSFSGNRPDGIVNDKGEKLCHVL